MTPPPSRITSTGVFLLVVMTYAGLSSYLTSLSRGWYGALDQPFFQPPDLVFAIVWPLNFLALGVVGAAYCFTQPQHASRTFTGLFASSAIFSLLWAYLFYLPHMLFAAGLSLLVAAALTWLLLVAAYRANPWLGAGLVVYASWLSLATVLAFAYAV